MKQLIIAGTGIKFLSHLTVEVKSVIEKSSCVVFLLNEPAIKNWITKNAKKYISMDSVYFSSAQRVDSYAKIADEVLKYLQEHDDLCFLIYGHPTIFSSITSEIISKVTSQEVNIQMMPGISALDCLFADLNIDPGMSGLQSYDATEFIVYDHSFSVVSHLVLWQIAIIGKTEIVKNNEININFQKKAVNILLRKLMEVYPSEHQIVLYVASQYPGFPFEAQYLKLKDLNVVDIPRLATLYIPPVRKRQMNIDVCNQLKNITKD